MSAAKENVFYVASPDLMTGFPTWPVEADGGAARADMIDGKATAEYLSEDDDLWTLLDLEHDLEDRGSCFAAIAMSEATPLVWLEKVIPALLDSELPEIDAIQRLRLAARLTDVQARRALNHVVRGELERLVVGAHGATVPAIPAQVDGLIAAAVERRDQDATDLLVHWIFEHSPQRDDDPGVRRLTSMISKAARG